MTEKSLRPDENSMVIPISSQMPDSRYLNTLKRTLSKMNYFSNSDILYLTALGGAVPNAVKTAERLKSLCDDFDVNIVYTGRGKCLSKGETVKNQKPVDKIVIGLSTKDLKPQYETLETEILDSKKKVSESIRIMG